MMVPYRNLNYKAQKSAMVLSCLDIQDIHGINGIILNFIIASSIAQAQYIGLEILLEMRSSVVQNPVGEHSKTTLHIFIVVFRQMHLMELTFSGFNILRFLAVANFANINSDETFCPVGYSLVIIPNSVRGVCHQSLIKYWRKQSEFFLESYHS